MLTRIYNGVKYQDNESERVDDALTLEHPLSVSVNGVPFTLTMQTPGNEADLVRGLLFAEGVFKKKSGDFDLQIEELSPEGFVSKVNVIIDEADLDKSQINKRNLLSVASCGICGKTELSAPSGDSLHDENVLNTDDIATMFDEMSKQQTAFIHSGGCHGASIFNREKNMLVLREDIGRHNAVDKTIGALLREGRLKEGKFLLISGRVSYEIITKCFSAGIPNLLAVSAPSSLAVDFAKELGITLYGFCRGNRATRYA
jgi:FdhD protein